MQLAGILATKTQILFSLACRIYNINAIYILYSDKGVLGSSYVHELLVRTTLQTPAHYKKAQNYPPDFDLYYMATQTPQAKCSRKVLTIIISI